MKIYTRAGDRGETSLLGGERVAKSHKRIEAYGDVDELNSVLGALAAALPGEHSELMDEIRNIQSNLLRAGAWLATTPDSPSASTLEEMPAERTKALEDAIDRMQGNLPGLRGFIIPGGRMAAAWAHLARTVCRRAERHVVLLSGQGGQSGQGKAAKQLREIIVYLNRLSDYLFVLARYCNKLMGVPDTLWKG